MFKMLHLPSILNFNWVFLHQQAKRVEISKFLKDNERKKYQLKMGPSETCFFLIFCFSLFRKLLKVTETCLKVKTYSISACLIFSNIFLLFLQVYRAKKK